MLFVYKKLHGVKKRYIGPPYIFINLNGLQVSVDPKDHSVEVPEMVFVELKDQTRKMREFIIFNFRFQGAGYLKLTAL